VVFIITSFWKDSSRFLLRPGNSGLKAKLEDIPPRGSMGPSGVFTETLSGTPSHGLLQKDRGFVGSLIPFEGNLPSAF
jgi:hypothetical protein